MNFRLFVKISFSSYWINDDIIASLVYLWENTHPKVILPTLITDILSACGVTLYNSSVHLLALVNHFQSYLWTTDRAAMIICDVLKANWKEEEGNRWEEDEDELLNAYWGKTNKQIAKSIINDEMKDYRNFIMSIRILCQLEFFTDWLDFSSSSFWNFPLLSRYSSFHSDRPLLNSTSWLRIRKEANRRQKTCLSTSLLLIPLRPSPPSLFYIKHIAQQQKR